VPAPDAVCQHPRRQRVVTGDDPLRKGQTPVGFARSRGKLEALSRLGEERRARERYGLALLLGVAASEDVERTSCGPELPDPPNRDAAGVSQIRLGE
jgi:hypothetical protein